MLETGIGDILPAPSIIVTVVFGVIFRSVRNMHADALKGH